MVTIKSFTDLEQSRKLAEILPLESADMVIWGKDLDAIAATDAQKFMKGLKDRKMNYIPCWSLAALYHILPNTEHISTTLSRGGWEIEKAEYIDKWWCEYEEDNDHTKDITVTADNPVDACYELILKLHELNLL